MGGGVCGGCVTIACYSVEKIRAGFISNCTIGCNTILNKNIVKQGENKQNSLKTAVNHKLGMVFHIGPTLVFKK